MQGSHRHCPLPSDSERPTDFLADLPTVCALSRLKLELEIPMGMHVLQIDVMGGAPSAQILGQIEKEVLRWRAIVVHRQKLAPFILSKLAPDCAAVSPAIPDTHLQETEAKGPRLAPDKLRSGLVLDLCCNVGVIYAKFC